MIVGFNDSSIIGAEGGPSAQACLRVFSGVLETDIVFSITVTELTGTIIIKHQIPFFPLLFRY